MLRKEKDHNAKLQIGIFFQASFLSYKGVNRVEVTKQSFYVGYIKVTVQLGLSTCLILEAEAQVLDALLPTAIGVLGQFWSQQVGTQVLSTLHHDGSQVLGTQ